MNTLFQRKQGTASVDNFDRLSQHYGLYEQGENLPQRAVYQKLIASAIATQLNSHQRKTLQLYYFEKLTIYQIAELEQISPSAVSKRLRTARGKIHNFAVTCLDSGLFKS